MNPTPNFKHALRAAIPSAACAVVWALCLMALPGLKAAAQSSPTGTAPHVYTPQPGGQRGLGQQDETPDAPSIEEEKRLRLLNAVRQKSLVSDAGKLLKLVQELNTEFAAGHVDELTPEQLRKVAEIEKLAHNVKTKMSTSVRGLAPYPMSILPIR